MLESSLAMRILDQVNDPDVIIRSGGNSTVSCVSEGTEVYAVKNYSGRQDGLERLDREWWALNFLDKTLPDLAPQALWREDGLQIAIHSWVGGVRPALNSSTVASMLTMLESLHKLHKRNTGNRLIPSAIDSVHENSNLVEQIKARLKLLKKSSGYGVLEILKEIESCLTSIIGRGVSQAADVNRVLTLSPSDFGPHNLLFEEQEDIMRIVDLEFFGVDDSSKIIGDTVLHPLTPWAESSLDEFITGTHEIFATNLDGLRSKLPLLSLKWATIIAGRLVRLQSGTPHQQDKLELAEKALFYTELAMAPSLESIFSRIIERNGR